MSGLDGPEKLVIVPIFAALPPEQQARVFEDAPAGSRKVHDEAHFLKTSHELWSGRIKQASFSCQAFYHFAQAPRETFHWDVQVILATNIAETSITVPGVRYVVDPGFVKARSYSSRTGADSLQVQCQALLAMQPLTHP